MPVPPKTSLPITTPKLMPIATCQRGIVGGQISGKSIPVTKKPSFTSCFLTTAKRTSQAPPTAKVTISTGR
ncbi:MAG: hypothetical protein BWZ10_02925 [candidate division BRC1 bacterium ADurb.BinA364]|nr:MAG: hypothetical protein BWZ10_02925 [candidate division BRC1 bacterium ADurb.BinA364]